MAAPARVLSNLSLPAPPGVAIRAFGEYPLAGSGPASAAPGPSAPHPARRALRDILPLIPAAERPDALVIASPEYLPIPADLASFRGVKILLITDWNVCLRFLPGLCPLFDFCFTDWPGYRLLRRAGIANVFHQPLFGHDPEVFRPLGLTRNLDVSFCGNLNGGLHGERNRLLARVARWAGGRPAHLRQAFGPAYVEVLNRSRLVFNYSIRGEANMRLFEAMACGVAPLVEASNQEAAILFQEGKHYFRYHPDRLEARLEELLSDPVRLAEAGEAARAAVARHTKADQIRSLLEIAGREAPIPARPAPGGGPPGHPGGIPGADPDGSRLGNSHVTRGEAGPGEPGCAPPSAPGSGGPLSPEAALNSALLRMLGSSYTPSEALAEIQALSPSLPGLDALALPAVLLTLLESAAGPLPAVEAFLERFLDEGRQPAPIAAFFRMRLEAARGRWEAALSLAEACARALDGLRLPSGEAPEARLQRLRPWYARYYPPIHLGKGFNTDINRAYREDLGADGGAASPSAPPGAAAAPAVDKPSAFASLLQAHCRAVRARALLALARPAEALAAAEALPEAFASVDARDIRARAAEAAGHPGRARREWEAAFAERPLDTEVWDRLAGTLMREGDRGALLAFLEDVLVLARAFLPEDQARRVRERLEQERGAAGSGIGAPNEAGL